MLSGGLAFAMANGNAERIIPTCVYALSFIHGYHSAARSSQCGFRASIRAIFFARDQPFNLLFAGDGEMYVVEGRPVEEALYVVFAGEAFQFVEFVLEDALWRLPVKPT